MDNNDFLGSFAQENVTFKTQVVKSVSVGDNFWKVMIFVEKDRFVDTSTTDWIDAPGLTGVKCCSVSADTYASLAKGLLQSWLYDLFCNGFNGDCILVACAENVAETETPGQEDTEAFINGMTDAYNALKAYAYHKTVCAGNDDKVLAPIAVALAKLCATDKQLLSSAPYYPYTTITPETLISDELYSALNTAKVDAFMSCHADITRNGALYSLGLALANINGSGTSVGTSMDMIKSSMISPSGENGKNLSKTIRDTLYSAHIQTFKPIGDNTGSVAAIGDMTIQGDIVSASWIIAYVTYMSKVRIAQMITVPDFLKNATNYGNIVSVLNIYLPMFGVDGSGRLSGINISAPAFANLPSADKDEIIIPNAWSATYTDHVRKVQITGSLYIGA